MSFQSHSEHPGGFTLIEIVIVLILLGILSAVAVPKFFDLEDEAEQKAAAASAAEIQARLDATFGSKVLEGVPCTEARSFAADLHHLADSNDNNFGEFSFQTQGNVLDGVLGLQYKRNGGEWKDVAGLSLVLPKCSGDEQIGYSALGREAFNIFMSNSFGSGYTNEDDNYKFDIIANGDSITLRVTDKHATDGWAVDIMKNRNWPYVQTAKVVDVSTQWPKPKKDLQLSNLPNGVTAAERNYQVDIFVSHCPNFDQIFTIETREKNGESYKVIVPKKITQL